MSAIPVDLRGARVRLRDLRMADWPAIHAYASNPEVCRYQVWGPNTEDQTRTFVEVAAASAAEAPRRRYALAIELTGEDKVVGLAELNIRDAGFSIGEVGYVLQSEYWGRGIATESARLLLRFGFETLHLHRIYATCDPRNVASSRVMEKNGMMYEGRMREVLRLRDGWRDSLMYAILAHEWRDGVHMGLPDAGHTM